MTGYCKKCLTSRSEDKLGDKCKTPGCGGIIEREPEFSELVDVLPEPMTCGRRAENGMDQENGPFKMSGRNLDRWEKFKTIDNRICSYCGSLHPDDMFRLVHEAAVTPPDGDYRGTVSIEPSDKKYKVYVRQPGVRNAMEGGIKFYMQHLPRNSDGSLAITDEQQKEYGEAVRRSQSRFDLWLSRQYPKPSVNESDVEISH